MSEMMAVNVIHWVTFCWVLGRAFAPRGAWRPTYLDATAAVVAGASYLVVAVNGLSGFGEAIDAAQTSPLLVLVQILAVAGVYIVLTWLSVKIRVAVGRPSRVADELEVRLG